MDLSFAGDTMKNFGIKKKDDIGTIYRRLTLSRIYSGEQSWKWKRTFYKRFRLSLDNRINSHVVIVGESGSGKSNLARLLIKELHENGVRILLFDPHNEYVDLAETISADLYDAANSWINIMDIGEMNKEEKSSEVTKMLKKTFRLGDVQSYILYRCIWYTYHIAESNGSVPNIKNLMYSIRAFMRKSSGQELRTLESLERRLALLDNGKSGREVGISKAMEKNAIFLLSSLHTNESQSLYLEGMLKRIYSRMLLMEKSDSGRICVVVDEAEKLGEESIIGKIASEGRKYGIGIVAIAQRAKSIDKDLRNNAAVFVSFCQREPEELNYVANFIAGGNESRRFIEVKKALRCLRCGFGIFSSFEEEPRIIRFEIAKKGRRTIPYILEGALVSPLSEMHIYNLLSKEGYSDNEIESALSRMVEERSVVSYEIESGRLSGRWYLRSGLNSPEHDICVALISSVLKECGIRNYIYNKAYGPDIIAFYNGKRIAVEYETGKKDIEKSVAMLRSRMKEYDDVLLIANNKAVDEYVGKGLAAASISTLFEKNAGEIITLLMSSRMEP